MQRKPVPAGLPALQKLAAPLPVQPGIALDGDHDSGNGQLTAGFEEWLAVVIGTAAIGVLGRKTRLTLQDQRRRAA